MNFSVIQQYHPLRACVVLGIALQQGFISMKAKDSISASTQIRKPISVYLIVTYLFFVLLLMSIALIYTNVWRLGGNASEHDFRIYFLSSVIIAFLVCISLFSKTKQLKNMKSRFSRYKYFEIQNFDLQVITNQLIHDFGFQVISSNDSITIFEKVIEKNIGNILKVNISAIKKESILEISLLENNSTGRYNFVANSTYSGLCRNIYDKLSCSEFR